MSILIVSITGGLIVGIVGVIIVVHLVRTTNTLALITGYAIVHNWADRLGLESVPGCACTTCKTPKHLRIGPPQPKP